MVSLNPASPKLVVTSAVSFWRANEVWESGAVARQLEDARSESKDELIVGATFYQEPKMSKVGRLLSGAAKIAVPALAAAGILAAGITALPALAVAGALGFMAAAFTLGEGKGLVETGEDLVAAFGHQKTSGLTAWRAGSEPRNLEALEADSLPNAGAREMLTANMVDYPNSFHIVHANGHGFGSKYVAGMPGADFANAVNEGAAQGQNEVDVAVLDTCFGANFEELARFGPAVKFVVAFEDAIPNDNSNAGRIPLPAMLAEALGESTPRAMAIEMAKAASKHFETPQKLAIASVPVAERLRKSNKEMLRQGTDSTVAAIDLQALQGRLHPALGKAGAELSKALNDPNFTAAVQEAKKAAEIEAGGDLIDLGGFLSPLLASAAEGSALQISLQEAMESLEETLLFKRTGESFPLSGLSVHTKENPGRPSEIAGQPTRPLDGEHLPKGWVDFIKRAF